MLMLDTTGCKALAGNNEDSVIEYLSPSRLVLLLDAEEATQWCRLAYFSQQKIELSLGHEP